MVLVKELVPPEDETMLLELLNTTPVGESGVVDVLDGRDSAQEWALGHGGLGSSGELAHLPRRAICFSRRSGADTPTTDLGVLTLGARWEPVLDVAGLDLHLALDDEDRRLATRAVLAWGAITRDLPGRLRPCANDRCRLFLLDRSRANTARWCSMAICGNRMKARRHYRRVREVR